MGSIDCSHLANTVVIRHAAAGAGCRFWLDPALVCFGCCGRGSASVIVFFLTISTNSRLFTERAVFLITNLIHIVRAPRAYFLPASTALTSHFVPCFHACVSTSQCSSPYSLRVFPFFLHFFIYFFPSASVSNISACTVDTLRCPVFLAHCCLGVSEHIASVRLLRQRAIFVGTSPHPLSLLRVHRPL